MNPLPSKEKIEETRLLVIGDLMIDHYLKGVVERISPEYPVPVVRLECEESVLGGAANVVENLVALGSRPLVMGVVGDDEQGNLLKEEIEKLGLSSEGIFTDSGRPTTVKTRVLSQNHQMLRIDRENSDPIEGKVLKQAIEWIVRQLDQVSGILVSDYNKGLLVPELIECIIQEARERGLRVFVDPKGHGFEKYRGASFLTPNRGEAKKNCGVQFK